MPSLKISPSRVFVEKRPYAQMFQSEYRTGRYSLEEVLEALWATPIKEVRDMCINLLTSKSFHYTSNLRTRAHLRDTILLSQPSLSASAQLLKLYLEYSKWYWLGGGVTRNLSEAARERRRLRVIRTAYLFLMKLYCQEGGEWVGSTAILKVVLRDTIDRLPLDYNKERFKNDILIFMLCKFTSFYKGLSKHEPKVDSQLEGELSMIAEALRATKLYHQGLYISFRGVAQAIERGAVLAFGSFERTPFREEVARVKCLALANLVCDILKENKPKLALPA